MLDDDDPALFPKLTDAQVQMLSRHGEVRPIEAGEVLWGRGESSYDVMVVLDGLVAVVMNSGPEALEVAVQRPGDPHGRVEPFHWPRQRSRGNRQEGWVGLGDPGRRVSGTGWRELEFSDFVLQTLFRRRQALERLALGVRIVGSKFDPDTQRLREFAIRNRLLFDWADVDDDRGRAWLTELGVEGQALSFC